MNKNNLLPLVIAAAALSFSSCHNSDKEFDDFEYSAVYFASQTPVRTLVMGDDIYDTTIDNQHKCEVYATMGGVYANNRVVSIGIEVDNSICDDLYFEDETTPVTPLPEDYYTLASNTITLDNTLMGAVEVHFEDAFFKDEKALSNYYVLPLVMTNATNVDKILRGVTTIEEPNYFPLADWTELPRDFVLYCVKYINKWDASYLRRGKDIITIDNGTPTEVVREEQYVEDDEIVEVATESLTEALYSVEMSGSGDESVTCEMLLTFDGDDCTITAVDDTNFTVRGSGDFKVDGEKNSWGNQDRNALYLNYVIETTIGSEEVKYESSDTMVVQTRGVAAETFSPVLRN